MTLQTNKTPLLHGPSKSMKSCQFLGGGGAPVIFYFNAYGTPIHRGEKTSGGSSFAL